MGSPPNAPRPPRSSEPPPLPYKLAPDAVTGPQSWPDPHADADDSCDPDCDGCAWCDQSWWRDRYALLYRSHEQLIHEVRTTADVLADSNDREAQAASRHLRAKVGDAMVRRNKIAARPPEEL